MLKTHLDNVTGIAVLEPDNSLSESDFKSAASIIDPYIEEHGVLRGLIIATKEFPGWESFAAFLSHLSFVKNHHKKITRIAIVTDSPIGNLADSIVDHFVAAEVVSFGYSQKNKAQEWILATTDG
ncbi:MAG: STAS/SEC14 domain-containing protein [Halieaceae bacterium]